MTLHAAWPAERFFWAVLDAPGVTRAGVLPLGLLPMLEEDVPVDVASLHAVGVPLGGGRLAVCAAERSELDRLPPATLTLTPTSLPPFLEGEVATPGQFNLLVAAYQPQPLRQRRLRRHAAAAAVVILAGLLLAIGLHRRGSFWRDHAASARDAAARVAAAAMPGGRPESLEAHARRLRSRRELLGQGAPPPDAAVALAALLQAWPSGVESSPQSISVGPAGIALAVSLRGEPATFLKAFTPPPGWVLDEPRLNAAESITRLSLQLRPSRRTL